MSAVAIASGVAVAVMVSAPASTVLPFPTNARVVPMTCASGLRMVMLRIATAPPPAVDVASSSEVAETVTVPEPTCAPPMPASVVAVTWERA